MATSIKILIHISHCKYVFYVKNLMEDLFLFSFFNLIKWYINAVFIFCQTNEYMTYVDILTAENLSSIYLANMDLNYWSIRLSSRMGGDRVNGYLILASCEYITLSEYIKFWCNIQVIIYPLEYWSWKG